MSLRSFGLAILAAAAFSVPALASDAEAVPVKSTVTGTLVSADDAGYPMFFLNILPAGAAEPTGYLFNNEAAEIEGGDINALVGKTVEATVETKKEVGPIDIMMNGKTILPEDDQEMRLMPVEGEKSVTGTLGGAAAVTASDLPDLLTITAKDGTTVSFEYYVDDKLVAANGKEVTMRYTIDDRSDVVAIKAAK